VTSLDGEGRIIGLDEESLENRCLRDVTVNEIMQFSDDDDDKWLMNGGRGCLLCVNTNTHRQIKPEYAQSTGVGNGSHRVNDFGGSLCQARNLFRCFQY